MNPNGPLLMLSFAIALVGCGRSPIPSPPATSKPATPPITVLPVELTVNQRSTTEIPGSGGKLSITVDDVTRGQAMVSVVRTGAAPILGPVSMKQGDLQELQVDGIGYILYLAELSNALLGEDSASLTLDAATIGALSESEKIDRLIQHVEAMGGAIFIRNGTEHTPSEAADHLRQKSEAAGDDLKTASDFIEQIASHSSLTGEVYQIRNADGLTVPAGDFLRKHLAGMEDGK